MAPHEEALRAALVGGAAIILGLLALPRGGAGRPISSAGTAFALGALLISIVGLLPLAPSRGVAGILWAAAAAASILLAVRWRARNAGFTLRPKIPRVPRRGRVAWLGLAGLAALGAALHIAFAFQTRLDYDELSYHLPLATHFPESFAGEWPMFYGRLPMLVPSLARFAASADGPGTGPAMLHAFAVIAGASCVHSIAARLGGRSPGRLLAAVLFLWHPMLLDAGSKHLADPWVALYSAAACEALLGLWARRRPAPDQRGRHVLFALMCGAAPAAKLGALGLVSAPLAMLWLLAAARSRALRPDRATAAAMAVAASLPLAIWFVPATAIPGTYPSADFIRSQRARVVEVHHPQTPLQSGYWASARAKAGLPAYTLADIVQPGVILDMEVPPIAGAVSFLLIGAIGSLLRPRALVPAGLLGAALASWLALLLVRDNPGRFWIGAVPWLCALCGAWAGPGGRGRSILRILTRPLIAAALAGIVAGQYRLLEFRAWTPDRNSWNARLAALGPGYAEAVLAARTEQSRGRVLVLFDGRNHLFGAGAEPVTAWDPPPSLARALDGAGTAQDLLRALRSQGITHVFVNEAELGRILSFYCRAGFTTDPRGAAGTRSPRFVEELRAFPAFALLEPSDEQVAALASLLRRARANAQIAVPAGPRSEIWLAPIPAAGDEVP